MNIFSKYHRRELYWKIRNFLFPQNKWLTQHIPNGHLDKDGILEIIIAATIIEFVDGEKGFEATVWDDTPSRLAVYNKLNNAYHWFKWQRPALERKADQMLDTELFSEKIRTNKPWAEFRAETHRDFDSRKNVLDDLHLRNIVKYRGHLWT